MDELWKSVLTEIEFSDKVSEFQYKTFFIDTKISSIEGTHATINVKSTFHIKTFEVKFSDIIKEILNQKGHKIETISYRENSKKSSKKQVRDTIQSSKTAPKSTRSGARLEDLFSKKPTKAFDGLNPKYTFDNFIVGSNNDLAFHAAQAVSKNPGQKYNPLFFYGNTGLGKTHLMQAIGNEIKKNYPELTILYITIENFTKDFLENVRYKKQGFADKYRNVDVLIIDDIQFIAGKEKTQEEFFHTFNVLHQANKQIIISSDRPPKNIPTLSDRLRTRFEGGMTIDIQFPDLETRQIIIENKAEQSGFSLSSEVVDFLASNIKTNIRELEGILNQLFAIAELRGVTPDIEMAQGMISKDVKSNRPQHLTDKRIIDKTCKFYNISKDDILSKSRTKDINHARQVACYLMKYEIKMSFPQIGKIFGRDHTTIMNAVSKIEKGLKLDIEIRNQIQDLTDLIYE